MVRNKQSNLIASVKMLNIGVINKYTTNYGIGGGYSVLVNYQSFLSNLLSLAPPQLNFSINCIRNRLLRVRFIELFDFIIYQHLNKRTNILPLATSQIAHLCHQFNYVCPQNPASGGWGLRPQTPKQPPLCEFLATRLFVFVEYLCSCSLKMRTKSLKKIQN